MNKKAFTLVELLSVIVILTIILLIAVPKMNDIKKTSAEKTLASSAQLIARKAEDNYIEYKTKGILDEITCETVSGLTSEYELCEIDFDNKGKAYVTILGKGRYQNMAVCNGTRDEAVVTENCDVDYVKLEVNLNGGTITQRLKYVYQKDDQIELDTPIKRGYIFVEWNIKSGNSTLNDNILTIGSENTIIEAIWEKDENYIENNDILLTLNLNGGSINRELTSYHKPGDVIELEIPTREGYIFTGWRCNDLGTVVSGNVITLGNMDVEIKAQWKSTLYKLTVDLDGGEDNFEYNEGYVSSSIVSLVEPTKEGYKFNGWIIKSGTGASINGNKLVMGTNTTEVQATWIKIFTLTVNTKAGMTVVARKGDLTVTKVANSSGKVVFNEVEIGTWTLTVTDGTEISDPVSVEMIENKEIELYIFKSYLHITYPAKSTITCKNGENTFTDINNTDQKKEVSFSITDAGIWTVTAISNEDSSVNASKQISITTNGEQKTQELDYNLWIYKNGEEFTELTLYKNNSSNVQLSFDKIIMTGAGSYGENAVRTTNKIDLTKYKKLHCYAKVTNEIFPVGDRSVQKLGLVTSSEIHYDPLSYTQGYNYYTVIDTTSKIYTLDISNISGEYFVAIGGANSAEVYEIWLEY